MKLYTYYRSSAAYRVRIALHCKGLDFESIPVHLLRGGGEQKQPAYRDKHPLGLVPALESDAGVLTQSLAIMEWLEEVYPKPPLLPADAGARAQVRALANTIACDIHPLNNLRVLNYLTQDLALSEAQKNQWYRHWVHAGLLAVERLLEHSAAPGRYCWGDQVTLADCCLVPQVANAQRFDCPLDAMPHILRINANCLALEAFQKAEPARQPDAP